MSHAIKLSGKFEIEGPIQIRHDYQLTLTGSVDSITKHDDGGVDEFVYSLKPLYGEIVTDKGETVKVVRKGSKSQVWRGRVQGRGEDYDKIMTLLLDNSDEVIDYLLKKL